MKTAKSKKLFAAAIALVAATNAVSGALTQSTYEPYAISTLAGLAGAFGSADGTGSAARFNNPFSVAVDRAGNVYVADQQNHTIRKITSGGVVSTLAGLAGAQGSADGAGSAARFSFPEGVAVDSAGNIYVGDTGNETIRKITSGGVVSTLAGLAGAQGSADGTGNTARFDEPNGVAVDSAGNVYVADQLNHTIRKITFAGVVSTLAGLAGAQGSADGSGSAARFNQPYSVAVDSTGNVYVADAFNETIRKITSGGVVSTLAGLALNAGSADGTGSAARFNLPEGVAVDGAGNVYVGDLGNSTIRKVTSGGIVTTLAGLADTLGSADGTGSAALFDRPRGMAADAAGNIYVADYDNSTIRAGVPTQVLSPPVITSPLVATGTVGLRFIYQLEASGATSLGTSNLAPGLTFNTTLGALTGMPTSAGTFQVGLSATNSGGTTNATLSLTVQPAPTSGPVIISSTSATGRAGQPFSFHVVTTGGTPGARVSASGLPPGLSIDAVTGLISGTPAAEGSSAVTLNVTDGGFTTSSIVQLTVTADPALPVIISPSVTFLTPGQFFSYTIITSPPFNPSDPTIFTLVGTLPAGLSFDAATGTISGIYTGILGPSTTGGLNKPDLAGGALLGSIQLFATNSHGTSTFQLLFVAAPSGTVNIATRLQVGTAENVLIGGFIITGTAPKVVIIRALGPSTGVPGALQDTTLELHDSANNVVFNDNWRDTQEQLISDTGIPPTDDRESAIVIGLDPGNYTAIVSGKNGTTGIGLVEAYDLGTASLDTSGSAKLANIATRGFVNTGDNVMIGGAIISGPNTRVIVRAIGPSLTQFGISNALADPTLELHDGSGSLISSNDDWRSTQEQEIIATGLMPTDDRESAIVATLASGNYTAIVRGKNETTGVAIVEAYNLQ